MKGRSNGSTNYRFAFNNQEFENELDNEIFCYRMYRSEIARFLSADPLFLKFPWNSSYCFAENRVIEAIELEGLEAFFVHGTSQSNSGTVFSDAAETELQKIAGNTKSDFSFSWNAPKLNNENDRSIAARALVNHVIETRKKMIENKEITTDETISLIGYSHGGNVAIQAAEILNKDYNVRVNLITVSTPAYNDQNDKENPGRTLGINEHRHIVHEDDIVSLFAGGDQKYTNIKTQNTVVTDSEVDIDGGIDAHTDFPGHSDLPAVLKKVPKMSSPSKPIKIDEKNKQLDTGN